MADKAQAWVYTEDFIPLSNALLQAHQTASELGVPRVSTGTGTALRMLAAVSGARAVLEIGTGTGVSGLWLLDGMAAGGVLTTIDCESELLPHARRAFRGAGVPSHRTRLIAGWALDVLPRMATGGYAGAGLGGALRVPPTGAQPLGCALCCVGYSGSCGCNRGLGAKEERPAPLCPLWSGRLQCLGVVGHVVWFRFFVCVVGEGLCVVRYGCFVWFRAPCCGIRASLRHLGRRCAT